MKKLLSLLLALMMALSLAACGSSAGSTQTETQPPSQAATEAATQAPTEAAETQPPAKEGTTFNIYAQNEAFKVLLEKYYTVPQGVTVNWIIPEDENAYREQLDTALAAQSGAPADEKIDLFLAGQEEVAKYANSPLTMDVSAIGVTPTDTMYPFTIQAASDADGIMKGVAYQCCPAVLVYRRSIARNVLGVSDPESVQEALSDWEKFDEVAAAAKEKGYYMTASYAETYPAFAASRSVAWVDGNNHLQTDPIIADYLAQAKNHLENNYTLDQDFRSGETDQQILPTGKTLCFFAPAWYYNSHMASVLEAEKANSDWAICPGPQPFFWGGTWLLAAAGTDNPSMVADIMNAFTFNEEICSALVAEEKLLSNHSAVNRKYAEDPAFGNPFLGGQNDIAILAELAESIPFHCGTPYDEVLNRELPAIFLDYFLGEITEEEAYADFYAFINENCPDIITPAVN